MGRRSSAFAAWAWKNKRRDGVQAGPPGTPEGSSRDPAVIEKLKKILEKQHSKEVQEVFSKVIEVSRDQLTTEQIRQREKEQMLRLGAPVPKKHVTLTDARSQMREFRENLRIELKQRRQGEIADNPTKESFLAQHRKQRREKEMKKKHQSLKERRRLKINNPTRGKFDSQGTLHLSKRDAEIIVRGPKGWAAANAKQARKEERKGRARRFGGKKGKKKKKRIHHL